MAKCLFRICTTYMPCYLEYMVLMWSTVERSYMEEPGSKASVRSRDGIQGNVLLYIGFYNNANHNIVCVHDIDFWTCDFLS